MASSNSPSSSQEPTIPLAARPPTSTAASRRLPPPCWSHDETVALIDAYRGKWYSLQRGNLRAPHWQEVADGVAARCPLSDPPKTSIQCRHKMEKLRKRYRGEIQRIGNTPRGSRYPSSWVHFKQMDAMELGHSSSDPTNEDDDEADGGDDDDNEDELLLYPKGINQAMALPLPLPLNRRYDNRVPAGNRNGNGVRIKIPNISAAAPAPPLSPFNQYNSNRSFDDYPPAVKPQYGYMKESRGMKRREKSSCSSNPMDEMVAAIHKLGDGFLKIEKMKMDMAREVETTRMKMEMKRTELILESQQRLVDSFSETVMEKKNKKLKRMSSPES